ncbi:hypothetical protein FIBSPDRAFT_449880 [Athelia psychrophila]|uniref:Peptidase S33 tripeptidyl aminopeptidase-like C-terminal domain-containing protein n=1 Tax=Athelia psychrophila TaxID=1759441 RepID=A0A167UCZ6_9AGAM|nr:hypothetical protein FIBSPDRAFT_449880 [Fibularhizoctonia sp. CBS 109695]
MPRHIPRPCGTLTKSCSPSNTHPVRKLAPPNVRCMPQMPSASASSSNDPSRPQALSSPSAIWVTGSRNICSAPCCSGQCTNPFNYSPASQTFLSPLKRALFPRLPICPLSRLASSATAPPLSWTQVREEVSHAIACSAKSPNEVDLDYPAHFKQLMGIRVHSAQLRRMEDSREVDAQNIAHPLLVQSRTADPVTPLEHARAVTARYGRANLVV